MIESLTVSLKKLASKSGADKYETSDGSFTVYIPQKFSRESTATEKFALTFSDAPLTLTDGIYLSFKLDKKANKSGGDKYVDQNDNSFNIYVPQKISRSSAMHSMSPVMHSMTPVMHSMTPECTENVLKTLNIMLTPCKN
jgi:hypothetical protein